MLVNPAAACLGAAIAVADQMLNVVSELKL